MGKIIKNNKHIVIAAIAVLAFSAAIFCHYIYYLRTLTPYKFVELTTLFRDYDKYMPASFLAEADSEQGFTLVFYKNTDGAYDCAVLRKNDLGIYNVVRLSGHMTTEMDYSANHHMDSDISSEPAYYWSGIYTGSGNVPEEAYGLSWGVLTDDSVEKVFLDEKECYISSAQDGLRFFWLLEEFEPDSDPFNTGAIPQLIMN